MRGRRDLLITVKEQLKSEYATEDIVKRAEKHRGRLALLMPPTIEEFINKYSFFSAGERVISVSRVRNALEYYYGDDGK